MAWLAISLGISIVISFLIPFPYSFVVIIGFFLGINYFMRKKQLRMMGMGGMGSFLGGRERAVTFYCVNCGFKHNDRSCPRCGSTATRIV
jgi:hypothetical protein